ncbi:hypothetical protein SCLCIDRAFT_1224393 [Scleroderma citrinum Foug A]|uniref:Uncharacterized protein n=1 Tax=Scleroderma citrinum Foug A TaxID=1036808 RepID=A0A0C3CSI7_9AGAM|nr:hypothetical protein SCLCIDRAFT_1224393 [Scleroderma citrinum Foug A]
MGHITPVHPLQCPSSRFPLYSEVVRAKSPAHKTCKGRYPNFRCHGYPIEASDEGCQWTEVRRGKHHNKAKEVLPIH